MTHPIAKKIAERIDAEYVGRDDDIYKLTNDIRDEFLSGYYDDILGKSDPTIDDVREEAYRVWRDGTYMIVVPGNRSIISANCHTAERVEAPTIASAYAALRALPDKEGM